MSRNKWVEFLLYMLSNQMIYWFGVYIGVNPLISASIAIICNIGYLKTKGYYEARNENSIPPV